MRVGKDVITTMYYYKNESSRWMTNFEWILIGRKKKGRGKVKYTKPWNSRGFSNGD